MLLDARPLKTYPCMTFHRTAAPYTAQIKQLASTKKKDAYCLCLQKTGRKIMETRKKA